MRLHDQQITAEVAGEQSGGQFGISKTDTGHILVILRDKLYSDKIMAVLREYGTNALDAHVETNQTKRPIKVTLPTRFSPNLTIRDYGTGLSEDQVYNIYTQYGRSTKRNSDDAIGQLGLGCKSAFAYSQQFTVTTWNAGKKMVFTAYIDPSNEGRMTKLMETQSDEPTGVEVTVPVREKDIPLFHQKAQQCYYFFEPQPEINIELRAPEYALQRGWWRVKTHFDQDQAAPVAVMGSIGYPLRADRINGITEDERSLLGLPLEIRFGIGELSISANREDLEYTDHTIKNIRQRLLAIRKEFENEVNQQFAAATNVWEARLLYWKYRSVMTARTLTPSPAYSTRRSSDFIERLVDQLASWNGVKLSTHSWRENSIGIIANKGQVKTLEKNMDRFSARTGANNNFHVVPGTVIYVANSKAAYMQRILQNRKDHALVYVPNTTKDLGRSELDQWIAKFGLTGIPVIETETLPYDPAGVGARSGPSAIVAAKQNISVFELKQGFSPTTYPKSENWVAATVDQAGGTGIYVGLFSYEPEVGTKQLSLGQMRSQFNTLKALADASYQPPTVIGVKRKDAEKMGPGWQTWDVWYEKEYKRLLTAANIAQDVADYAAVSSMDYDFRRYLQDQSNRIVRLKSRLGDDHLISRIYNQMLAGKAKLDLFNRDKSRAALLSQLQNDVNLLTNVKSQYAALPTINDLQKVYPMLHLVNFWTSYGVSDELLDQAIHYINLVDTHNALTQKEET